MKIDKLSYKKCMKEIYTDEKTNPVSFISYGALYAGKQMGLSSEEFYFDIEKSYTAQKEIYKRHSCDDLPYYDFPHGEILDLGGELIVPKSQSLELPMVKKFPINSLDEAEYYTLPPIKERQFVNLRTRFFEYAIKKGNSGVSISAGSPFTVVGSMVEPSLLMRWIAKEPKTVEKLLKQAIQYLCETADIFIEKFGIENCSAHSNYPFESNDLISPKNFEKLALPAMINIHEKLRNKGIKKYSIHLCGNHNKNLAYFKELKLEEGSFISCDEKNDLKEVSKVLGTQYTYGGNMSTRLLIEGSPEEVFKQSMQIIQEMKHNERGFVLMPSCDLPINAKPKNLDAMYCAVKKFG